jgi:glucose/arabinose dehydrogenase/lysophospholipase L1-like esterase
MLFNRLHAALAGLIVCSALAIQSRAADAPALKLEKGDHICFIGNTLAEREQHYAWVETLIQARFPDLELVFRNLGYPGDEVRLDKRLRSQAFGTPNEWLAGKAAPPHRRKGDETDVAANRFENVNTNADVVFCFFGYNESYAGEAGLPAFKTDLANMLKDMLAQKYNGKSAPRLVLVSPIAFENLHDRNLPDGVEQNKNLKLYTDAMAEVAKASNVAFIDLFSPTLDTFSKPPSDGFLGLFKDKPKHYTINGVHINEAGDLLVAQLVDRGLFGEAPKHKDAILKKINAAALDKNFYWFNRYRTTDGYSNYGGRGALAFVDGQNNYEVLQRESEVLDVMTRNRDKAVWFAAAGKDCAIDDENAPPFITVKTNKPGPGPGGAHTFFTGEEAIKHFKLGAHLKANLFASEEKFPELVAMQQMKFDSKGRLWVTVWPSYPHWKPKTPMADKLLILEDTNGDGVADKVTTFAGDLNSPTGFEFYNGGVLIASGPEIYFLKDTNGDDKYDVKERVLTGNDTADTHHAANSFVLDAGGALYFQEGTFHHTQIESPWGPTERNANAGVYRYEPRTQKFETYVSYGFANPHGHVFDRWGQDFVTDGTGAETFWAPTFSGKIYYPNKHNKPPKPYNQRTRPCPATEVLSSKHFPDEMQGNLLVENVIGVQGILQYKFADKGSGFNCTEVEPIVTSDDPNFRPCDVKVGPDGAIYFVDWHNPIVGHMQHNLRDPSRDHVHGRVYRITYDGRPLQKPVAVDGLPIEKLLDLLKDSDDGLRSRARAELTERDSDKVIAAANKWLAALDKKDPDYEHQVLEALWLHQSHNVVDEALLKQVLRSPDFRARAAATNVLCYWRDRVKDPLVLLKAQATDENPRVRLAAVRACSFFKTPDAAEVALESVALPQDEFLKFTLDETMKTLGQFKK